MKEYLRFFLPLALYQVLLGFASFPLTVAMARGGNPAPGLAAYGISLSLVAVVTPALVGLSQLAIVFGPLPGNRRPIVAISVTLTAAALAGELLLGYMPLGPMAFTSLLGVGEELLPPVIASFRVLLWFVVPMVVRDLGLARLLIAGQTRLITLAMLGRILAVMLWAHLCTVYQVAAGAQIGAVGQVLGISVEAVLTWLALSWTRPAGPGAVSADVPLLTMPRASWFLGPLAVAALLGGAVQPTIYKALASHGDAARNIAALAVATTVNGVLVGPATALNQMALVLARRADRWSRVLALAGWVCGGLMLVMFALAYTSPGEQLVRGMFTLAPSVWLASRSALRVLLYLIPAMVVLQLVTARRMAQGSTGGVFILGKGAAILAAGIAAFGLSRTFGVTAAALALVVAPTAESIVMLAFIQRNERSRSL